MDSLTALATDFAAIEAEIAALQSTSETPPARSGRQLIAALRSLIAQARLTEDLLADPQEKARAADLIAQMAAREAALFRQLFVAAE